MPFNIALIGGITRPSASFTTTIDFLAVGGGGGGGSDMGGGGGAGGFISGSFTIPHGERIYIEIGAGGSGAPAGVSQPNGTDGGLTFISSSRGAITSSVFDIKAHGGGGGNSEYGNAGSAGSGGSGGGATGGSSNPGSALYAGTTFTQRRNEGNGGGTYGGSYYPGSGGGASTGGRNNPGDGGAGLPCDFLGTRYFFAGGGAGGGYSARAGNGGAGGGGGGGPKVSGGGVGDTTSINPAGDGGVGTLGSQTNQPGGNAAKASGGGGGGSAHYNINNPGGAGGSGIVMLKIPSSSYTSAAFGASVFEVGSNIILQWTGSGYYTT